MKRLCISALALIAVQPAHAALPPQFQNARDLDAMVGYVKQHAVVVAAIRSIDVTNHAIHFGDGCTVQFSRAPAADSRPGPGARLEFKSATCAVD